MHYLVPYVVSVAVVYRRSSLDLVEIESAWSPELDLIAIPAVFLAQ